MKRKEMVCATCIKMDLAVGCRLGPTSIVINDINTHWCGQGVWHQWSERFQEIESFYWGEWEEVHV